MVVKFYFLKNLLSEKHQKEEDILKNSWTILKDEFWNQHKYRPVGFNKFKIQNYD